MTEVDGSDHDAIVCALDVLVESRGLGDEDDIGVKRFIRGGGLILFTGVVPETCGKPHVLCGDG